MKLSDLLEQLIQASKVLGQAEETEERAKQDYIGGGGYSWGYYGQRYWDDIYEARSKVETIKEKIDNFKA